MLQSRRQQLLEDNGNLSFLNRTYNEFKVGSGHFVVCTSCFDELRSPETLLDNTLRFLGIKFFNFLADFRYFYECKKKYKCACSSLNRTLSKLLLDLSIYISDNAFYLNSST